MVIPVIYRVSSILLAVHNFQVLRPNKARGTPARRACCSSTVRRRTLPPLKRPHLCIVTEVRQHLLHGLLDFRRVATLALRRVQERCRSQQLVIQGFGQLLHPRLPGVPAGLMRSRSLLAPPFFTNISPASPGRPGGRCCARASSLCWLGSTLCCRSCHHL